MGLGQWLEVRLRLPGLLFLARVSCMFHSGKGNQQLIIVAWYFLGFPSVIVCVYSEWFVFEKLFVFPRNLPGLGCPRPGQVLVPRTWWTLIGCLFLTCHVLMTSSSNFFIQSVGQGLRCDVLIGNAFHAAMLASKFDTLSAMLASKFYNGRTHGFSSMESIAKVK